MRDPTELLKCAEEYIQRSWDARDQDLRLLLRETADAWKAVAREVVRMNEFEKNPRS